MSGRQSRRIRNIALRDYRRRCGLGWSAGLCRRVLIGGSLRVMFCGGRMRGCRIVAWI